MKAVRDVRQFRRKLDHRWIVITVSIRRMRVERAVDSIIELSLTVFETNPEVPQVPANRVS